MFSLAYDSAKTSAVLHYLWSHNQKFDVCLCFRLKNVNIFSSVFSCQKFQNHDFNGWCPFMGSIKCCVGLDKTNDMVMVLQSSSVTKKCSRALAFKWHWQLHKGRCSIEDNHGCGQPSKVKCSISEKVKDMVYSDRGHTLRSLASELILLLQCMIIWKHS